MAIEFEMKYRATPKQQEAVKNALFGDTVTYRMESTYYDTPTGALSQMRCTLRRRQENDKTIYALKMPAAEGRAEFEVEETDLPQALSALCKLSKFPQPELLDEEKLVAVCGAAFTRTAITIAAEDCTLEIALDEGILTGGGNTAPLREIEVELKTGTPEAAVRYGKQLAETYDLTPETESKFRRAYLLAGGK